MERHFMSGQSCVYSPSGRLYGKICTPIFQECSPRSLGATGGDVWDDPKGKIGEAPPHTVHISGIMPCPSGRSLPGLDGPRGSGKGHSSGTVFLPFVSGFAPSAPSLASPGAVSFLGFLNQMAREDIAMVLRSATKAKTPLSPGRC
jgi:hypothetical protein